MKTKNPFFRRGKSRLEHPKRKQTSPSPSEDEEYAIETQPPIPRQRHRSMDTGVEATIARKDSMKLEGISEQQWASFSSNDSQETTASDMMKCLNQLRIQDVSVSTSTQTLSPTSIPKLAPPPLSSRGSAPNPFSETTSNGHSINLERSSKSLSNSRRGHPSEDKADSEVMTSFSKETHFEPNPPNHSFVEMSSKNDEKLSLPETAPSPWVDFEAPAFPPNLLSPIPSHELSKSKSETESQDKETFCLSARSSKSALRPPIHKPPISRTLPAQQTGSSTHSDAASMPLKGANGTARNAWADSDDDAASLSAERVLEDNPFASMTLHKRYSSGCSLASKAGDTSFHSVVTKHGAPQLELVEIVNACFSGNKLSKYSVWGEVKFKLSGTMALSTEQLPVLGSRALEILDGYRLVLRLKCVLHHVFLKRVIAKKALMEWDEHNHGFTRQTSLTMNEARKGLVESKIMHWNLTRCYQEALHNPVTVLKYPVQENTLSGPPLKIQIQWQRPKKTGLPVLVDVALIPNRKLSTSLWGVAVRLKGFETSTCGVEAAACPESRWNPTDCTFEWSIPIINPDDTPHHLRVKVTETSESCPEYNFSAQVKFVMPHATLSGTLLLGWIERKDAIQSEPLFGEDASELHGADLIFCEKMCLSGNYGADTNY